MLVRLLKIYYKEENKQKYKLSILGNIDGIKERNIKIEFNKSENNLIKLFGYDRELKYEKNDLNFQEIFAIIDDMPMRKLEMRKLEILEMNNIMQYCTGPLKESLYELIIKRMYELIIVNLGEIAEEAKNIMKV